MAAEVYRGWKIYIIVSRTVDGWTSGSPAVSLSQGGKTVEKVLPQPTRTFRRALEAKRYALATAKRWIDEQG
jgi:hypothetical protein